MPRATSSGSVTRCNRWRRITTDGRGVTHAAAANRDPSSSRKCRCGRDREKLRAFASLREAMKSSHPISSSSDSATGSRAVTDPSMCSVNTPSQPTTITFSTVSSSSNGWNRPIPNTASKIAFAWACSAAMLHGFAATCRARVSAATRPVMIARPSSRSSSPDPARPSRANWSATSARNACTNAQSTPPVGEELETCPSAGDTGTAAATPGEAGAPARTGRNSGNPPRSGATGGSCPFGPLIPWPP